MTPEELKITPETIANRFAMARFRTPNTNPDGMDSKEFFDFLLEDINIIARKEAIAFAKWTLESDCEYSATDEDQWTKSYSRENITTAELYTIFQEQNKSKI